MLLKRVILKNFRVYEKETSIELSGLTTLVGRNDAGKSSVLEALEIFFNQEIVKAEPLDASVGSRSSVITIGCVFSEVPHEKIILDVTAQTTLRDEHLLNRDGDLEVRKSFDVGGAKVKESVSVKAFHPRNEQMNDLLLLKNSELKRRARQLDVEDGGMDQNSNPSIRSAIWRSAAHLEFEEREIQVDKEDAKAIWQALEKQLPMFALFQADRPSRDEDREAQDPMRVAIQEALKEIEGQLEAVKETVKNKVSEVAKLTLQKLNEIAPDLAEELQPDFRTDPKWEQIFKLSLKGENNIPVNKRGSGVRRLILLSFFRAAAERKQELRSAPQIIYAIEEPETSQHPIQQRLLVDAFEELVDNGCQVILTTHNPALAALIPSDGIRYVHSEAGQIRIERGDNILEKVSKELGVLPSHRIKAFVCLEGKHDVNFLKRVSSILHASDATVPDLTNEGKVAFCLLGGSSLSEWVQERYLRGFNVPEIHLYDRGTEQPPRYEAAAAAVNSRNDGSFACLTGKREIENYLHPDAISEARQIIINVDDSCSVPELAAEAVHNGALGAGGVWATLEKEKQERKISAAKRWLNSEAASKMTVARLEERDPNGDIKDWLLRVGQMCQ